MLRVFKFTFNPFQENTYILANDKNECAIIDPGCYNKKEEETLVTTIKNNQLSPTLLLNTHCHIDHVFGNDFVSKSFGLTPKIHREEKIVLDNVTRVAEMYGLHYTKSPNPEYYIGNTIRLGEEELEILFVPGHSPGHVAFHSPTNEILISGDVLFRQSIGRTDLPGGDMATLMDSIKDKLMCLPKNTRIYAGHMEDTTIGDEMRLNPYLSGLTFT
ncbi:MAG: MBL fold metallo-hydrolase [Flavobacteriales bacterium]|nr:MBL fold metallo-hydrolase [Flavobacteriales bacterium]